jgi:hypothetical protein
MSTLQNYETQNLFPPGTTISDATKFLDIDLPDLAPDIKHRQAMLNILFDVAEQVTKNDSSQTQTIWAEEASHRAMNMLYLMLMLNRPKMYKPFCTIRAAEEYRLAEEIAEGFASLNVTGQHINQSCIKPLNRIIKNIVTLFGYSLFSVRLSISAQSMGLSTEKNRAIVLICSDLVINALKEGVRRMTRGCIEITLEKLTTNVSQLIVKDDFASTARYISSPGYGIVSALAEILEADLVYRNLERRGAHIEFLFRT